MSFPKQDRALMLILAISFGLSRIIYFLAGVRFDLTPLLWFWQLIDPILLKKHLLQSVYYLHTQPPLFNLFAGALLKLSSGPGPVLFYFIYLLMGLMMCLFLFLTMRRLGVSQRIATLLSLIFIVSPSAVLYENWFFYTYPLAATVTICVYFLHRFLSNPQLKTGFLFFLLLSVLILTRTLFHLIWFLVVVLFLIHYRKDLTRKICIAASIPFFLVVFVYAKNVIVFGTLPSSTTLGISFFKMASARTSPADLKQLVKQQKLSNAALVRPYSWLSTYSADLRSVPQTDIPVLDQTIRTTGFNNYNNLAYHTIAKNYFTDALYLIRHYPLRYLSSVVESFKIFFRSSSDYVFLNANQKRIELPNQLFDTILYGRLPIHSGRTCWFLLTGYFLVIGGSLVKSATYLKTGTFDRNASLTILFMAANVLYVAVLGNFLEVDDNNRYRFEIEPFFVILLGVALQRFGSRKQKGTS
jgi:hypothetical protein